jgi:hypothetical protein
MFRISYEVHMPMLMGVIYCFVARGFGSQCHVVEGVDMKEGCPKATQE